MKRFFSILFVLLIAGFCGILVGCGDKYANLSISVSTASEREEDGSVTLYLGGELTDATEELTITMENAPKDFNYIPMFSMSNEIIKINSNNELIDKGVKKLITATAPGSTILTIYTSEGGKSTTLKINVVKMATGIEFKKDLKFGLIREYGATLNIDANKYLNIYPTDSNQRTIKYSIVSYTKGGVEIEGSPALNELYVNTKTGLVTILNSNTEITSVKVSARIDNSKAYDKQGIVLPDIPCTQPVEVKLFNKISPNDISLYVANDIAEITLPSEPTPEDIENLEKITVTDATVKTLIKNIDKINATNVILKVKTDEIISVDYPTDLLNIPVFIVENNIFNGGTTNYYEDMEGYKYYAFTVTATRSTTEGNYADDIYKLNYEIGYKDFIVDGYPLIKTQKLVCETFIKTFSINDTTILSGSDYDLKVYKTDATNNTKIKVAVANPLNITDENSKFTMSVFKKNGDDLIDITKTYNQYFRLTDNKGTVNYLINEDDEYTVFNNNNTFTIKANSVFVAIGEVYIFRISAYRPNSVLDKFDGVTDAEVDAMKATANVVATITQGIETINTYTYSLTEYDEGGNEITVDYEGEFDQDKFVGDTVINIDNLNTNELKVAIGVGPTGADITGLKVSCLDSKIVDYSISDGILTLKPIVIGSTKVLIGANTLNNVYTIDVNVYNPIESFKVNLQSTEREAGIGYYENVDNSLSKVTSVLGSPIYVVLTTNPTTAKYKQLNYYVKDITYLPHKEVAVGARGIYSDENFIFDSENLFFEFYNDAAVGRTYQVSIEMINYDNSVIIQNFECSTYIPNNYSTRISKTTIYNPLKLNYENKVEDLLFTNDCNSSFSINVDEKDEKATYRFKEYGEFVVKVNGFTNNSIFNQKYDVVSNTYWFTVNEDAVKYITSYPQLIYISAQLNELGTVKTSTVYIVLSDPTTVKGLTALDIDKSEIYFKKGITEDKTVSIMVNPSAALNKELYVRQYVLDNATHTYVDVTDAAETSRVCTVEGSVSMGSTQYVYKYNISTMSSNLKAGNAVLVFMPKDKINFFNQFTTLNAGDVYDVIDIWYDCLVITVQSSDGTKENPYHVSNLYELKEIGQNETTLSKFYVLTANIIVADNWTPIGLDQTKGFSGGLNGVYSFYYIKDKTTKTYRYSISNLNYTYKDSLISTFGLFSKIDEGGLIENLEITYSYINANFIYYEEGKTFNFGGITGVNKGDIINTKVNYNNTNIVAGNSASIGGVAGINEGKIENTETKHSGVFGSFNIQAKMATTGATLYVGGIAGYNKGDINGSLAEPNETPEISYGSAGFDCSANITVSKGAGCEDITVMSVGGAVGYNTESTISNLSIQANINASDFNNVGGLVGDCFSQNGADEAVIYNSYFCGKVVGNDNVGGLIGYAHGEAGNRIKISYSSAENYNDTANKERKFIIGREFVGGLIGQTSYCDITYSYAVSYFEEDDTYDIYGSSDKIAGFIGGAQRTLVQYCASIMNINVTGSPSYAAAFLTRIGSEVDCDYFFARGKSSKPASVDPLIDGAAGKSNYYTTFDTGNIVSAKSLVTGDDKWDWTNPELPYLKNEFGKALFAITPLTITATIKPNNDGILDKINVGRENEKEIAYKEGYISNSDTTDTRSAIVFLHTFEEGSYTQAEIIKMEEELRVYNTIEISMLADLMVSPLTNKSSRLTIKSSNPDVVYVNTNGSLLLKKEGEVTITIGSKLNSEKYNTTIYLIVRKGITEFILSESSNVTTENDITIKEEEIEILKSSTKSLFVGTTFEVLLEDFDSLKYKEIENITDGLDGRTAFGTRYIVTVDSFNDAIFGSTDVIHNLAGLFTINGLAWDYFEDGETKYYFVDVLYGSTTSINPINATGTNPCIIQAIPYLTVRYVAEDGSSSTRNIFFNDCEKEFSIKIIKGAEAITFTNDGVELPQLYTLKLVVNMDTNYEEDQILLTNFDEYTREGYAHRLQIVNGLQTYTYDAKGNVVRVSAEFTINYLNKEVMLTENQVYTLNFMALSNAQVRNSYTFTYTPQGILDVGYKIYSKIGDYKNNNGSDTRIIYNGQTALLAVEVYPYFSNFDSMEILYSTAVDNTMSIQQYKYDVENSSFSDYVEGGAVYDKNVGLSVNKATGADTYKDNDNGIYSYSKVYFFGILVGSDVPDYTDFVIRVKFYKQGQQVEPYDSKFEFTAVSQPTISLAFEDKTLLDAGGVYNLPLGTENTMDVRLKNYIGEIEWTITSPTGYPLNKAQTLAFTPKLVGDKYVVTIGDLEDSSSYLDLIGHTFNIKATIYKDDFVSTHDINFQVTLFTIQSILVEGVSNDYLSVPVYSTTPLGVTIKYYASSTISRWYLNWRNAYNTTYTGLYGYPLASTFSDFVNQLTVSINKESIWYAMSNVSGNFEKLVKGQSYSDELFEVNDYMGEFALYGYRTDITTQMKTVIPISYKHGVPGRVIYEGDPPIIKEGFDEKISFTHNFNMIFVYKTGLINAIPVATQDDFANMEEGKDYRLINDIVLDKYIPISTKIASFDGNNYTVYVTGFDYSAAYAGGANLGLFDTVDEDTTLYNVKVCYTERTIASVVDGETVLSPSPNPLVVSLRNASHVYFGGIATTNNGSITNAIVSGKINIDVNVNEESGVAITETLNGGITATNRGYITNSKVENFEFAGYGNTAGVVGVNERIITATYTNELKLVNKSTNFTGGFAYQNLEGALIESCYVQGQRLASDLGIRNQGAGVQASGQVGGFVYENIGTIQNCYANISLASSSFLAGFAFVGEGTSVINNCYSICKRLGNNNATDSPFSGGTNGTSVEFSGKITNSYYFSDGWSRFSGEQAKPLTADEFATSSVFVAYDMATNTSKGEYIDGRGEYQYANGYTWMMVAGKPELVATAVQTTSQMKYAGKSKVYSDISAVFPYNEAASPEINMGDTIIDVELEDGTILQLHYDYEHIINSKQIIFEKRVIDPIDYTAYSIKPDEGGNYYVWVENGIAEPEEGEIYEYFIYQNGEMGSRNGVFFDSNGKFADGTSVEEYGTLKNIHYVVTKAVYKNQELEVSLDKENNYRANDTITCYYTPDCTKITKIVYQTCESAQYYYTDFVDGKSEMYGSITNPYLIYDYNSFSVYLSSNAKTGVYFRFVRDIDLDYRTPPTMYTVFNGIIQGNFMTVENINITYLSQEETASDGFGLFAEIVATSQDSSISNLTLEVGEVSSSTHNYVGALAGKVSTGEESNTNRVLFSNITVKSTEEDNGYVLGKNYVGGLIGYGIGNTQLKAIHTSIWVNATRDFYQNKNQYYIYQTIDISDLNTTYLVLGENKTVRELAKETLGISDAINDYDLITKYNEFVRDNVSYAGGVVGVLDTNNLYNHSMEEYNANDLTVDGDSVAVGVTVGGVIGYLGEKAKARDLKVILDSNNQYVGAVAYAGGIVGENRGKIISSTIESKEIKTYEYGKLEDENEYFRALNNTSVIGVGGLVGLNIGSSGENGIIENSSANVNVRNSYALIGGGAVGRMVGGKLDGVIATGSVRARNILGGMVGTVNDRKSIVYTPTNNYGFIHSNPQLLVLPETDGKKDQAFFKNCIAANNWILEDYAYLDSINRLVAGFIGLEVFSTYETTSGVYYSDFGASEMERNFFGNTLYKTSTDIVARYIPAMYGGSECDVYGIDQNVHNHKSIESAGVQMVYPYAGNRIYKETPEEYTCTVSPAESANVGSAERDEVLTFTAADGYTFEYGSVVGSPTIIVGEGQTIRVTKGGVTQEFIVGQSYLGSATKTVGKVVCHAEGEPLAIVRVVVNIRSTINTSKWTVTKTYDVALNKILLGEHSLVEGASYVSKLGAFSSKPIYVNDVYIAIGRRLPDKSVVKEIILNSVKNENSENVLSNVQVVYEYPVENNEFVSEKRRVEGIGYTYTLTINSKAVVYRYLTEDYWNIPENFYENINSADAYFPNVNLYLNVKKWEDFAATSFAGGAGTEADPFIIETNEQFAHMINVVNDGTHSGRYYKLVNDIDLSGKYWTPIGTTAHPFNGTFDASYTIVGGAEPTISTRTIYYSMVNPRGNDNVEYDYAGIFGVVGSGGNVSNVRTLGGNIQGKVAGGVIGLYQAESIIANVENGNTVVGSVYAGGVVGKASGNEVKITQTTNNGKITLKTKADLSVSPTDSFYVGGIAGSVDYIAFEKECFNYGTITVTDEITNYALSTPIKAKTYIGGVAGYVAKTASKRTYNYGQINVVSNADRLYIGGVTGYCVNNYTGGSNKAKIIVDYKTIDSIKDDYAVTSTTHVGNPIDGTAIANIGGVVGCSGGISMSANEEKIEFVCEYNTNSIISIGGVAGCVLAQNGSVVEQNSNVAIIESQTPNTSTFNIIGGIVGSILNKGKVINFVNNYNTGDIISSATSYQICGGLLGTTIAELQKRGTTYNCYAIGSFPFEATTDYASVIVNIYFNYNLGTISISGAEDAYNSRGAIIGLLNDSNVKFMKSGGGATDPYNYYLTGSVARYAMKYEGSEFVAAGATENCVSMLATTMHNELFDDLNRVGNYSVWENKYYSWFPTLKNNPTEVLWENYTENFSISGGSYSISSAEQLAYLAKAVNSGLISTEGKTYKLTSTINLENKYFTPIGTEAYPFKGTFDGNGFVIKNLTIDGDITVYGQSYLNTAKVDIGEGLTRNYGSLFGFVEDATITNLGLEAPIIKNVGFAAGIAYSAKNSLISYCYTDKNEFMVAGNPFEVGNLDVGYYAGGIVCFATDCYPTAENNYKGGIYNCYNNIKITNSNDNRVLAGIAIIDHCYVENCYNKAAVSCDATYVTIGPIVATKKVDDNTNYVKYCYSIGEIAAKRPVIVYTSETGLLIDDITYGEPTIQNLTNWGWDMTSVWTNEYTLNYYNPTDEVGLYNPSLRGLGQNWKSTESENLTPYGSHGEAIAGFNALQDAHKTSEKTGHTINFIHNVVVGTDTYTYYLIENAEQLALLSRQVNDGLLATDSCEFILVNDIDLSGKYWTPIGKNSNYAFRGIFNFNGYSINGLTIDSSTLAYAGLFGYVKGGIIANGYIHNAFIRLESKDSTVDLYAGTLAANVYDTTIKNISVSTSIGVFSSKHAIAGGLVSTFSILSQHQADEDDYAISNVVVNPNGPVSCGEYETEVLESVGSLLNGKDESPITKEHIIVGAFSNGGDTFAGGIVAKMKGMYTADSQEAVIEFATNNVGIASITKSLSSTAYAGGIAGMISENSRIKLSTNSKNSFIKSHSGMYDRIGGIVGYLYESAVVDCFNDSAYLESTKNGHTTSYLGGIVGFAEEPKLVSNCINTGYTRKNYNLGLTIWGGIIGYFDAYSDDFFITHNDWGASIFVKELGFTKCIGNVVKTDDNENLIIEVDSKLIMRGTVMDALKVGKDALDGGKLLTSYGFSTTYWVLGDGGIPSDPKLKSQVVKIVVGDGLALDTIKTEFVVGETIKVVQQSGTDTKVRIDMVYGVNQVSTIVDLTDVGGTYTYDLVLHELYNFEGIDGENYSGDGFGDTVIVFLTLVS